MSVAGISTALSALYQLNSSNSASGFQQVQATLQQLGQDLQTGNLPQAQSDFAALTKSLSSSEPAGSSPIAQEFSQLGQDLQSGNLTGAQQDYSQLQQDLQQRFLQSHHHHRGGGAQSTGGSQPNSLAELFRQLGQDLRTNNLSAARQAYAALQQDISQFATTPAGTPPDGNTSSIFSQTA